MWIARSLCVALCAILAVGALAQAQVRYTITDLGANYSDVTMNNQGHIVGERMNASTPWSTDARLIHGSQSRPFWTGTIGGINDAGLVVGALDGQSQTSDDRRAAIWQNGVTTMLPLPEGFKGSFATGVNNHGRVVGTLSWDGGTFDPNLGSVLPSRAGAFVWENGVIQNLNDLTSADAGMRLNTATDISDTGSIVGNGEAGSGRAIVGFLWKDGQVTNLDNCYPSAVNNSDQVVGDRFTFATLGGLSNAFGFHAAIWQNGQATDLALLPGCSGNSARDINNLGLVVGSSYSTPATINAPSLSMATLWDGDKAYDLNDLISPSAGYRLTSAECINDVGQILATATMRLNDGTAATRTVLLTPVPEPATLALLAVGGLATLRRRR